MTESMKLANRVSKRIALLIPHTDVNLETDLQRELPAGYSLAVERMWLDDVTEESERVMLASEAPRAARYLRPASPELGVFGCTSATAILGPEGEKQLIQDVSATLQCPVISAFGAVLDQLAEARLKRLVLFTPYVDSLTARFADGLTQLGYELVFSAGMGKASDVEIGEIRPDQIVDFVRDHKKHFGGCDGILISCTNLRALEARTILEKELNLPIITSNYAILKEIGKQLPIG